MGHRHWRTRRRACLLRLPQLTRLRSLYVQSGYYPSVLVDLQGLQVLDMMDCHTSRSLYGVPVVANAAGTATRVPSTLFGALVQLTGLRSLDLHDCAHGFLTEDKRQFSALTACSDIERLAIIQDSSTTSVLPRMAVHHFFPAGR